MRNKEHTLATLLASAMARARGQNAVADCHRIDNANGAAQKSFHFDQPLSVTEAKYTPYGTGRLFCVHAKSYFEPCQACHRRKAEADDQLARFLSRL